MDLEELVDQLNSSCLVILDFVAPVKCRGKKSKIAALVEQYYPCSGRSVGGLNANGLNINYKSLMRF